MLTELPLFPISILSSTFPPNFLRVGDAGCLHSLRTQGLLHTPLGGIYPGFCRQSLVRATRDLSEPESKFSFLWLLCVVLNPWSSPPPPPLYLLTLSWIPSEFLSDDLRPLKVSPSAENPRFASLFIPWEISSAPKAATITYKSATYSDLSPKYQHFI